MTHYEKKNLLNEIKILASHNSPYIIKFKSAFTHINELCIVTEYAQNGDILQIIKNKRKRNTKFTEDEIMHYFIQICVGIKYLHDNNIIHRDIKSANIFIDKNNNIKLGDFGIIKILQSYMMYAQTQIGTPLYMSPEIFKRERYDTKTDIWSLGCILYELMTLKPAFNADNLNVLKYKIFNCRFDKVTENYTHQLKNILHVLLNVNPRLRPTIDNIFNIPYVKKYISYINLNTDLNFLNLNLNFYENYIIPHRILEWDEVIKKIGGLNNTTIILPPISSKQIENKPIENKHTANRSTKHMVNKHLDKKSLLEHVPNNDLDNKNIEKKNIQDKVNNNKLIFIDVDIKQLKDDILIAQKMINSKLKKIEELENIKKNIHVQPNKNNNNNVTPLQRRIIDNDHSKISNIPKPPIYPRNKINNNLVPKPPEYANNNKGIIRRVYKQSNINYMNQIPNIKNDNEPTDNILIKIGSKHEKNYFL